MHRDVTSANILLTAGGGARMADFGLAQQLHEADAVVVTAPAGSDSMLMGTYGYCAPEYASTGAHGLMLLMGTGAGSAPGSHGGSARCQTEPV